MLATHKTVEATPLRFVLHLRRCKEMKTLYLTLAVVALFLMVMQSLITFATPPEEATVSNLERASGKWRIDVIEDNFYFSEGDAEKLKKDVLGFFVHAGSPTYSKLGHYFNCLAIILGFCVLGYLRERWLQRTKQRQNRVPGSN